MENVDQNTTKVWNTENDDQNNYTHNTIETTEIPGNTKLDREAQTR